MTKKYYYRFRVAINNLKKCLTIKDNQSFWIGVFAGAIGVTLGIVLRTLGWILWGVLL